MTLSHRCCRHITSPQISHSRRYYTSDALLPCQLLVHLIDVSKGVSTDEDHCCGVPKIEASASSATPEFGASRIRCLHASFYQCPSAPSSNPACAVAPFLRSAVCCYHPSKYHWHFYVSCPQQVQLIPEEQELERIIEMITWHRLLGQLRYVQ